jgi:hypothetical protein
MESAGDRSEPLSLQRPERPGSDWDGRTLPTSLPKDEILGHLVLSYLFDRGYERSAGALCASWGRCGVTVPDTKSFPEAKSLKERQKWTKLIVERGFVHESILSAGKWLAEYTKPLTSYSGATSIDPTSRAPVFEPFALLKTLHPWFVFRACLQQFVEYLRAEEPAQAIAYARRYLRVPLWEHALGDEKSTAAAAWLEELEDRLVLLAYSVPETSPLGKLMELQRREDLADELNALVVACERRQTGVGSALERLLRHLWSLRSLHEELGKDESSDFWRELDAPNLSEYLQKPDPFRSGPGKVSQRDESAE